MSIRRSTISRFARLRPARCAAAVACLAALLAGCGNGVGVIGANAPVVTSAPSSTPTVPAAPSDLVATAGDAEVSLTWAVSSGATAYNVKRAPSSGGPYAAVAAPTSTSYTDTSAANGVTYYYVVSAVNSAGESTNSTDVSATPVAPLQIPAAPVGLAATADDAEVALTWSASSGASGYHVKRATQSGGPYTQIAAPVTDSYLDAALSNGTTYYYVVSAVNGAGESANSAEVSATPVMPVQIPAVPAHLAAVAGDAQVSLTWSASAGAITYRLKRATSSGGPYTQIAAPASASYTDAPLSNGTTYYYVVSAVNSAGESANSAEAGATPEMPVQVPATPTSLVAIAGDTRVDLTWAASAGATGYHVKRSAVSGGPYTQVAAPTSASYTDAALSNGTTYYYVVSAVNAAGESANSAAVSAKPSAPAQAPPVPTGLAATAGDAQIALTWAASAGATGYHLKRATVSGGPYTQIAAPASASYADTSVSNGTTYYYVVSAVDAAGESANSAEVSATAVAPTQIPAVPTAVRAIPGNALVSLNWLASATATSYHVKRATVSGGPYTQIGAPTSASYTDYYRTNGVAYYYVVSAVNSAGESANSVPVSATPAVVNTTPMFTSFSPTSGSPGTVLTFKGSGFTGCNSAGIDWDAGFTYMGTIYDGVLTVVNDTTATYVVPADAENGQLWISNGTHTAWAASPLFTLIPNSLPSVPAGVIATPQASGNSVAMSWTPSARASGYHVKRSTVNGGPYVQVAAPTAASYVDAGLSNGTVYYYVVSAVNNIGESANSGQVSATPEAPVTGAVTVTVNAASTRPISPYVYGVNADAITIDRPMTVPNASVTFNRLGGNRWTAYNWQNNYSNAGSDLNYQNDNFLDSSTTPAHAVTSRIATDRANNRATLMTVPMLGYVSADDTGPVPVNGASVDTARFKTVQYAKGAPFTLTPSNANASVYMDEFVWAVDQSFPGQNVFGATPATQPVFVELDNEPDIWNFTHEEIETSTLIGYGAFFTKSINLATAIKNQYPNAKIFGPAVSVFSALFYWDGSYSPHPSASSPPFDWWADGYLAAFKTASTQYGAPLLDAFSLHWYTQVIDPTTGEMLVATTTGTNLSDATVQAIVQSPRSLWDPTFAEDSWISNDVVGLNGPGTLNSIQMIPRMLAKLGNSGMTTKLAFTEYFNGGNNHVAGLLAQADNLGAFGAYGLYAANIWPIGAAPYPLGAFSAFRNFDGAGAAFGDTSVAASSDTIANVAAYVSTDSTHAGRVVMVLINRSFAPQITTVSGQPLTGTAHLFQITGASAAGQGRVITPVAAGTQAVSGTAITVTLPALSVTTIDIY